MDVGIDTYRSRLDLIRWDAFRLAHGGTKTGGVIAGGEPAFAGRHFLGGTGFLWGHGEATDCMTNPSPQALTQLNFLTLAIAPVQAAFNSRQQLTGEAGRLYGAIDARALCDRLAAALQAGEFALPPAGRVLVWLNVDPAAALSPDYWAGWADQVNLYAFFAVMSAGPQVVQPFRAGVQCRFQLDAGHLRPNPQVLTALRGARTAWPGANSTSHACWADAPTTDAPDWSVFAGGQTPLIWRTVRGFTSAGSPPDVFDVDVANPGGGVANALDFMLQVQQWQPTLPVIGNYGIIHNDRVTKPILARVKADNIPAMNDTSGHYSVPVGRVAFIGRYLKPTVDPAQILTRAEAKMLSDDDMDTFTISEDRTALTANQNIGYFDPAFANGTSDGETAYTYCAEKLFQPPHTTVFFALDNLDLDSTTGAALTEAKSWLQDYFNLIRIARDTGVTQHPDYPYLIGVYGRGQVMQWLYEKGFVDMFWQTASPGTAGNKYPARPWYHANRWQFSVDANLKTAGWTAWKGADPDADWGDGGRWNLRNPLIGELTWVRLKAMINVFGNLTLPAPQ
jgi:hypothetical protein